LFRRGCCPSCGASFGRCRCEATRDGTDCTAPRLSDRPRQNQPMFDRILIANRGEIACRVARTARRMGIHAIAVYSDADADALHVAACDEAHRLGTAPPQESYLRGDRIIEIARWAGAQAI